MSKQVPWNKVIVEEFIKQAMLTKDEEEILRTRVAGWSRTQQALRLGMSVSTVDRIIYILKRKYDAVAKYDPVLPPRKKSAQETWQDTH